MAAPEFQICIFKKLGYCKFEGVRLPSGAERSDFTGNVNCKTDVTNVTSCDRAKVVPSLQDAEAIREKLGIE